MFMYCEHCGSQLPISEIVHVHIFPTNSFAFTDFGTLRKNKNKNHIPIKNHLLIYRDWKKPHTKKGLRKQDN